MLVPIDRSQLRVHQGKYLSHDTLTVGDVVKLNDGSIGDIKRIRVSNYLPSFFVKGRWRGKTKLMAKVIGVQYQPPTTRRHSAADGYALDYRMDLAISLDD